MTEPRPTFVPSPDLAFVAPREKPHLAEGARLLATVLGCPQIIVTYADEPLTESVRVVVLLDDAIDAARFGNAALWRLVGDSSSNVSVATPELLRLVGLPDAIVYDIVYNGYGEEPSLFNITRSSLFYCLNWHRKAPEQKRTSGLPRWWVCRAMALAGSPADSRWRYLFDVLARDLKIELRGLDSRGLAALLPLEARFSNTWDRTALAALRRAVLASPHLLPLWAFTHRWQPELVCQMTRLLAPAMNTSERKAALGCAYRLIGDDASANAIRDELSSSQWRLPDSCVIRTRPDRAAVNVGPVLLAFLLNELIRSGPSENLVLPPIRRHLNWRVIKGSQDSGLDKSNLFYLLSKRIVSRSLFDNWLALQELPAIACGHFFLTDHCYQFHCAILEDIWRKLVRRALSDISRPMIDIKPWPAGYRAALAVRYDVDRDVPADRVRRTVEIQKRWCRSVCGSWYFFTAAPFNERVKGLVQAYDQEYGIHTHRANEQVSGWGVTAHSGAGSEYWRGRATIEQLQSSGAEYAEAMIACFPLPRPGWLSDKKSHLWLTPLHFPLEGSTADTDTSYFDQRLAAFRRQRDVGGLVIIGTHPDCAETILDEVLGREDLAQVWATTVGNAVERVRSIMDYGAIELGVFAENPSNFCLRSRHTLADVSVIVFPPGQDRGQELILHLNAGVACPLKRVERDAIWTSGE
jgi:hypothetical protein